MFYCNRITYIGNRLLGHLFMCNRLHRLVIDYQNTIGAFSLKKIPKSKSKIIIKLYQSIILTRISSSQAKSSTITYLINQHNQSIIKHKCFNQSINPYLSKSLTSKRPNSLLMAKNVSLGRGFVKISARWFFVSTNSSTHACTKHNIRSTSR